MRPRGGPAGSPPARPPRTSLRVLVSAVFGTAAGLAAAAVVIASAPMVGRTPAAGAASMPTQDGAAGRSRARAVSPVSAVLAPAIDAGVVAAPDPEAARP